MQMKNALVYKHHFFILLLNLVSIANATGTKHRLAFTPSILQISSASSSPFNSIQSFWSKLPLFQPSSTTENNIKVMRLKSDLLNECKSIETQSRKIDEQRIKIEVIIDELARFNPTENTATSSLLKKPWLLLWTTEKEINLFNDWGISDGNITQTIASDGLLLENKIPFKRGGSLKVEGSLSIFPLSKSESYINELEEPRNNKRTYFQFKSAVLDLARWGEYTIPPIGEGWFDTIYLDDDLRIDRNSRDDILICSPL